MEAGRSSWKIWPEFWRNRLTQCATNAPQLVPQLSKQYRETIRELEEIRGVIDDDDEINKILAAREVNGKPGAVR